MLVQLTEDDLRAVVDERVTAALQELGDDRRLLTSEQVAERLGVGIGAVAELCASRGMPYRELGPRMRRFKWSEVEAWSATACGRNLEALPPTPKPRHLARVPAR
jgi:excisionase family DNA binding protein